ncbi:hypothetical protein SRB5_53330 [Streptomyces sp. RB5]|uniref:Aminoglycoside phosphotransferase n=1 Tax=Streptomyces smaragdinus TaxID=2585196 RepID=A0A7K0CNU6_9ACTN|nr:aminoglycoside phosphotransferase [Streptomyces smaragdinus]MQY15155.1 hypothetical protein [Streptomyces smaragdinus]
MSIPRRHFRDLPLEARRAVADKTGPIRAARTANGGMNSAVAVVLDTETGPLFVKGIPQDHPQAASQRREAAINPYLPRSCPWMYWHIETGGWILLGYEVIDGRHADYTPGSSDLPLVAAALNELQQVTAPTGIGIKHAEQRWADYCTPGSADLLAGDTLLHTDFAPDNILVDDRAHLIDWAWPTRGAAWIDPMMLALRLIEAGHSAADAVAFGRTFLSWATADPAGPQAFARANAEVWREIATADTSAWKQNMTRHATELAIHLQAT